MPRDTVVGLGEFLWDSYPEGKRLGGAPVNFAYHATALGNDGIVATRVGDDDLGSEALDLLGHAGVSIAYVQVDPHRPTGVTRVALDENREPTFSIPDEVAWDHLDWTPEWRNLAACADVVCFGSIALRTERSRQTILAFLAATPPGCLRVLDVNLRHSFFTAGLLDRLLGDADVVKVNAAELGLLADMLALPGDDSLSHAQALLARYDPELVCVTRGARGSLLATAAGTCEHDGYPVEVADTTGAGDAFTAALAHCHRRGLSLEETSAAANRLAAWVASQVGATPLMDPRLLQEMGMVS